MLAGVQIATEEYNKYWAYLIYKETVECLQQIKQTLFSDRK